MIDKKNLQIFNNVGYLRSALSDSAILPIVNEVQEISNNFNLAIPMNNSLAGNIKKEFELINSRSHIAEIVLPLIKDYDDYFRYSKTVSVVNLTNRQIVLDRVWVNFQAPTEFNPVHRHTGLFSFVIWINIPFYAEDEIARLPHNNADTIRSGTFNFYYINSLGKISEETIICDKNFEKNK